MVARDTARKELKTTLQVDIPASGPENALPLRSSDSSNDTSSDDTSSGGTSVSRVPTSIPLADPTIGQHLEEKMIERHQTFLEALTKHTTAQHTKFMVSMIEYHMTFLQAFTSAQVQQNTNLQSALAEQHRKAFEQQQEYLDTQRRTREELLSEQKLTMATVRNLLLTKREG
ncbi:hypothetical protein BGZ97_008464 [Linnemannia gamsii]|uniref:Uncharacterized protein n=1 Tax=Linnemannia gamsii TaxID=64522 RepID=A0A9P6QR34_9FUNG|nr:hypothetical protein BGZ97_008464 [Linnemannia gamsii]